MKNIIATVIKCIALLAFFSFSVHAQTVVNTCSLPSASGSTGSITLTCTSAIGSHHMMFVGVFPGSGTCPTITSISDSSGTSSYSIAGSHTSSNVCMAAGYSCLTGASGGTTITVNYNNTLTTFNRGVAVEVSGIVSSGCNDATGTWIFSSSASGISPTVTTVAAKTYVLGFLGSQVSGTHTAATGYTLRVDEQTVAIVSSNETLTGTYTPGGTGPTGTQWGGWAFSFITASVRRRGIVIQ